MLKEIVISTTSREIADALLLLKIPGATQREVDKFTAIKIMENHQKKKDADGKDTDGN